MYEEMKRLIKRVETLERLAVESNHGQRIAELETEVFSGIIPELMKKEVRLSALELEGDFVGMRFCCHCATRPEKIGGQCECACHE